jgi:hypothetical protein
MFLTVMDSVKPVIRPVPFHFSFTMDSEKELNSTDDNGEMKCHRRVLVSVASGQAEPQYMHGHQ